jgi:hypothetical protein
MIMMYRMRRMLLILLAVGILMALMVTPAFASINSTPFGEAGGAGSQGGGNGLYSNTTTDTFAGGTNVNPTGGRGGRCTNGGANCVGGGSG